jgi:hypothetical protein
MALSTSRPSDDIQMVRSLAPVSRAISDITRLSPGIGDRDAAQMTNSPSLIVRASLCAFYADVVAEPTKNRNPKNTLTLSDDAGRFRPMRLSARRCAQRRAAEAPCR